MTKEIGAKKGAARPAQPRADMQTGIYRLMLRWGLEPDDLT
jgi:hypothetical protein